jgi:ribosome biogenesis protein UTP30
MSESSIIGGIETQTAVALQALSGFVAMQKAANNGESLLDSTPSTFLMVTLNHVPSKLRLKPQRLSLSHPIQSDPRVCVITRDALHKLHKPQLKALGSTPLSISKLRKNYKSYEQKRLLCQSFDIFLADAAVLPMLPKLLGKTFFAKKKLPLAIDLSKTDIKGEYHSCILSTHLNLNNPHQELVKGW